MLCAFDGAWCHLQVDSSGRILEFESGGVPWKEHFFCLEEELDLAEERISYVIHTDPNGNWCVYAIPVSKLQGFDSRYLVFHSPAIASDFSNVVSQYTGCYVYFNAICMHSESYQYNSREFCWW